MAFFVLLLFLAVLVSAFVFLYRAIDANDKKAEASMAALNDDISAREEIRTLNASIEAIKGEKTELETHFAKSTDIVPFLNTIEGLAPQVGAKAEITSVNLLPDSSGLTVQINATGDFASLYKFLTLLENSPYELQFTGVDMQRQTSGQAPDANGKITAVQNPGWRAVFGIKLLSFVQ